MEKEPTIILLGVGAGRAYSALQTHLLRIDIPHECICVEDTKSINEIAASNKTFLITAQPPLSEIVLKSHGAAYIPPYLKNANYSSRRERRVKKR